MVGKCGSCTLANGCNECYRSKLVTTNGVGECVDGGIEHCYKYFTDSEYDGCEQCEGGRSPTYLNQINGKHRYDCSSTNQRANCLIDAVAIGGRRLLISTEHRKLLADPDDAINRYCARCSPGYTWDSPTNQCMQVSSAENCEYSEYLGGGQTGCQYCSENYFVGNNSSCEQITNPEKKGCNQFYQAYCDKCNLYLDYYSTGIDANGDETCTKWIPP